MDIQQILSDHEAWLLDRATGKRADLCRANLREANLREADLREADLSGADLSGADLSGADLSGADLSEADLSGADLSGADLSGADLSEADLSGADLSGAAGLPVAPSIPAIDGAILRAVGDDASCLNMDTWHCGTTHCRAGWAITLAGNAGAALERDIGSSAAAALIYAASRPGKIVPNFYADKQTALNDMRACAATDH